MATFTYRDHFIVAGVDFSAMAGTWLPKVSISWNTPGQHGIHFITKGSEGYQSASDAVDFGLAVGKSWVDDRLRLIEASSSSEFCSHVTQGAPEPTGELAKFVFGAH
jgi:hypothetical protein